MCASSFLGRLYNSLCYSICARAREHVHMYVIYCSLLLAPWAGALRAANPCVSLTQGPGSWQRHESVGSSRARRDCERTELCLQSGSTVGGSQGTCLSQRLCDTRASQMSLNTFQDYRRRCPRCNTHTLCAGGIHYRYCTDYMWCRGHRCRYPLPAWLLQLRSHCCCALRRIIAAARYSA